MPIDEHVEAAFFRSGYLLEQRVEAVCVDAGMEVHANLPLRDSTTGKQRETDLIAKWREKRQADRIWERPGHGASLLIECVRSDTPLVFMEKPARFVECAWVPALFGCPLYLPDPQNPNGFFRLEDEAEVSWCTTLNTVATQWHAFERKVGDKPLVASQRHDIYSTFEKLIQRAEEVADLTMPPDMIQAAFLGGWLIFVRPVLVVEGDLYVSVLKDGAQRLEERRHVHYLRTSLPRDQQVLWVIDVVTECELPAYLSNLRRKIETVERFCLENAQLVQDALHNDSAQQLTMRVRPHLSQGRVHVPRSSSRQQPSSGDSATTALSK
ncbi:MAG TPA: hypothetical protein VFF65_09130 [Phycisphaerales bacterium]|nr:hypothetical protein [Phycisphaerales bacterium]